jgi:hypothetical protein
VSNGYLIEIETMNKSDVVSERLRNQKLSAPEFRKPADVVRWLGAVQAQDFQAAKWALALRMRRGTNSIIEEAYNEGLILRTHLMRPTWHFATPEDIRWLLELTAPRVNMASGSNYRKLELDSSTFKRSNKALTNALRGGNHLTRAALKNVLNESGVAANDTVRLAHILLRAELDCVVCSGPRLGNQFTYALFDERVPATGALKRDEALAKLTQRYFTSHGPATLQDFIWWSGLTAADGQQGLALIDRHLKQELINEKIYHCSRPARPAKKVAHVAYLLPAYDEFFVAYKDRGTIFDLNDGLTAQGMLGPTLFVDGKVSGAWKRTNVNNSVTVTLSAAKALNKLERSALATAADRYAAFLGLPANIEYQPQMNAN